ncbi:MULTISPECIES: TonB-dependent siderophore receptor [unclassified Variovorax]|uniref:TonB-dependent siderophore receptor n=1 Tax=unclassified Variovorax TaxID=663243 RepID=UPI003F497404
MSDVTLPLLPPARLPAATRMPARKATLALAALLACATAPFAQTLSASPAVADGAMTWSLQADELGIVLARIARQGGRTISAAPALVAGRRAHAVQGRFTVAQAAQQALAGSGLALAQTPGGALTVVATESGAASAAPAATAATAAEASAALAEVRVTALADRSGTTEGTGSYAARGPSVAATGLNLSLKDTPQSISVMTQQRMEDENLTSVNQVLARTPGISTSVLGTERSAASARGYAITNYQLDGVSTHSEFLGLDALPTQSIADMALYDRVEVLRGASGLTTGAGDPSGVINLVRKKPTAAFQGSVEASAGSWGDRRAVLDLSTPLNASGSVRGRMVALHQQGDSYIDHYSKKKDVFYGVIEADLSASLKLTAGIDHQENRSRGSLSYLGFPLFNSSAEQTDFPVSFSGASRNNRFDTNSTSSFLALEQSLANDWKLKVSANSLRSRQREDSVYLAVNSGLFDKFTGDGLHLNGERRDYDLRTKTVDVKLGGPFSLFGRQHEAVIGFDYTDFRSLTHGSFDISGLDGAPVNVYRWDNGGSPVFGERFVTFDSTRRQKSIYGAGRFQLSDQLKLIVGGKVMNYDSDYITKTTAGYDASNPSSERRVFTPYAGLVYDLNANHTLYASFATIYNPQTSLDRRGVMLDPQEGNTYEAGIKSSSLDGRLTSSAAVYQIRQDNLAEVDEGQFVPGTTNTASRAVKGAKTQGIDLELNGALTRDWNLTASYNYSGSKDATGRRINTTFPRQMARLWTTYRLPGEWRRLTLGGGVEWSGGISYTGEAWQIDRTVTARQSAYAVASLMARYDVNDKLSVTLNVQNLFDRKYIASMSGWWYSGTYGAPRSAQVIARYKF